MKYMYVKCNSNKRESIIKENDNIRYESSESLKDKCNSCKVIDMNSYIDKKNTILDDKITKFFFDSIHKNHLKNR